MIRNTREKERFKKKKNGCLPDMFDPFIIPVTLLKRIEKTEANDISFKVL